MRSRLEKALKKSNAEFADIRIEKADRSHVNFRGEELDNVSSSSSLGGIVRALSKGGWGYATFNDIESIDKSVQEASEAASLVGSESTYFAESEPVEHVYKAEMEIDFRSVPLSEKKDLIEEYNTIMLRHHEKIETTNTYYGDSFRKTWYVNSDGSYIEDERPDAHTGFTATAKDGDNVQHGFDGVAGVEGFQIFRGLQEKAESSAQRAVDLLSAPPVKGGTYTVIMNPKMTGVFAHEAFGHLSESDFVYENDKMKEIMVLGKRFGPDILNIIDDGSIPGLRGTHAYDDEGVKTRKNYLIRDGILVGRLHCRETAAKMGEEVSGNARTVGYRNEPIVRMTNTYIDAGDSTFEDMIQDVDLGLYALDMVGGQTAMEMFTFSAAYGYMIRNGKVAELVRDVVLTGNVFETLMNIDKIANDLTWPPSGGGCGKGGQGGLPVGLGGPHIRLQNCIVGGRQS